MTNFSAIHVKRLYTGKKGEQIDDAVVVIGGEKIEAVFKHNELRALEQYGITEAEDLRDKYLVPGLIDSHVHTILPGDGTPGEDMSHLSKCEIEVIAVNNIQNALKKGITVLRDCGSQREVTFALKSALEHKRILGPDLIVCGAPVTSTGGHIYYMGGEANGEDEVRRLVRLQHKEGADFTKIIATGGGTKRVAPYCDNLTLAEIKTAVDESHRIGIKATAHVLSLDGIKNVIAMDIDGLEHGYFCRRDGSLEYDQSTAETIAKRNIMVSETIQVLESTIRFLKAKDRTPAEEKQLEAHQKTQDCLREMHSLMIRDGVSFLAGSDAGWRRCAFGDLYEGLGMLSDCGMKNDELLYIATAKPAEYLGIGDCVGTVQPNRQADLLLLGSDPMENIRNLSDVFRVYNRGIRV